MYILFLNKNEQHQSNISQFQDNSAEALYESISDDVEFLKVPFNHMLLFSQSLMHGNRINTAHETHWSLNCLFKGLMHPYAGKKLGEFFELIAMKAATKMSLSYVLPKEFNE